MTVADSARPVQVLLVEDSPGDVRLTREALREGVASHDLHVASDGVEALAFLRRQGAHGDAPRPDLILLDLNLPRLDGRAVLRAIKGDTDLGRIPVVVLTTSNDEHDIAASYGLHANAFITKPVDLDRFLAAIRALGTFWFAVAALPQV
jgi:two-component system, chemotaxis family, response regulator Rcp1